MDYLLEVVQSPPASLTLTQGSGFLLDAIQGVAGVGVTVGGPVLLEVLQGTQMTLEVATLGLQGPRGIPGPGGTGTGEEEMAYAERVDIASETLIYKGQAIPGTPEATALWRIRRLTLGLDGDVKTEWAAGTANFESSWANRLTLNYS